MLTAKYGALDTVRVLSDEAHAALAADYAEPATPGAKPRLKAKAVKTTEAERVALLGEVAWNLRGRPDAYDAAANAVYDGVETPGWMLSVAGSALANDHVIDPSKPNAKPRRKTKAVKAAEQGRFELLCEVLWNLVGRPMTLEAFCDEAYDHYIEA
jgi:hypothetical protein